MRLSILGIVLILLGILIIGAAYANPELTVVNISPTTTNTSANIPVASAYPSSTSSSSPTIFSSPTSTSITINYLTSFVAGSSSLRGTYSASTSVILSIYNTSSGTTIKQTISIPLTIKVVINSLNTNFDMAYINGSGSYTFTNPYHSGVSSAIYGFSWSSSSSVTVDYITMTLQASPTYYGQFSAQSPINIGHFYIGTAFNNMTKITSTSQVIDITMKIPGYIYVIFAEDNGTMQYFSTLYYNYQILYSNNSTQLPLKSTTLSNPSIMTVNGNSYTTYVSELYVNGPMNLTIQGYITGVNGQSQELMELFSNFTTTSLIIPYEHFTIDQYISFLIGGILIFIGAIVIFRK
jgi:hypothetical protein